MNLGRIRGAINDLPEPAYGLALAVLSSIVVRASNQDSDTRYARVTKSYKPGSAIEWYQQRLHAASLDIREIMNVPRAKAVVHLADGRNLEIVQNASVDLVVTSPSLSKCLRLS